MLLLLPTLKLRLWYFFIGSCILNHHLPKVSEVTPPPSSPIMISFHGRNPLYLRVAAHLLLSNHTASALPVELRQCMRNVSHTVFRRLCGLVFPGEDSKTNWWNSFAASTGPDWAWAISRFVCSWDLTNAISCGSLISFSNFSLEFTMRTWATAMMCAR